MFKIALFGYAGGGKTTLFKKLTGRQEEVYDPFKPNVGTGIYKDKNLYRITEIHKARKTVCPEFEICDFKGFPAETGFPDNYFRNFVDKDVIACVVNNFKNDARPDEEASSVLMELVFYDTERVAKILQSRQENADGVSSLQAEILKKSLRLMDEERLLNELAEEEKSMVQGMELLTTKSVILCFNGDAVQTNQERPYCIKQNFIETEDGEEFYKLIMKQLSLITFYTVKGDIARGWLIPGHYTARQAAGSVHKDMEKGFIKAAVVNVKDFFEIGSWQAAKNAGALRFLGPDSHLSDADIVEFYFNK